MLETFLAISKAIFVVAIVVPAIMGLLLSLFGFGAIRLTRLREQRGSEASVKRGSEASVKGMVGADT